MKRGVSNGGRCARAFRPLLFLVLASLAAPVAAADDLPLVRLREIAAAGAPGLALQRLDAEQPDAASDPERWVEWERARLDILVDARAWRRAIRRLNDLPPAAPEPFRRRAIERRAAFHLELDESSTARRLLRELVWTAGPGAAPEELRRWRRLIVRSYLVDRRTADAVTALRRYDQDYAEPSPQWTILRTRVLLAAGRAGEAVRRLPQDTGPELRALGLLARLRAGAEPPDRVHDRASELAAADGRTAEQAARLWFVAAEAASRLSAPAAHALAIERAAALADALPPSDTVFAVPGDALWSAWLDYGLAAGNERELLIGDDDAWFAAADAALPEHPVRARALLAVVAQRGKPAGRARAHGRLIDLLAESEPGMEAARRAYLDAARYADTRRIPENVRYRLVDDALADNDVERATGLLATLTEAPDDVDAFSWQLLRARVLVLGGRFEDGVAGLNRLLDEHARLGEERLDRFLQVIFDLQGAEEHEAALSLLGRLELRDLPPQRRRELLYWQAESRQDQERYQDAARLYLRSATLVDPRGGDPWGQTALYQAAGMLSEIGLVGDARRIYRRLLRVTENENRRATLRHRLQQLRLRRASPDDVPAPAGGDP